MELASNGFSEGMIMDLDPMSTPNNTVTSALNATLVTYNGNDYILQNDMGNGRVETAYLPEGFVPVGTCSFGGIIYVASYNPLTGVSQMGCFPSPERNFGLETDTANDQTIAIDDSKCYKYSSDLKTYINVINIPICEDITLSPGDKFIVTISQEQLASMYGYVDGIYKNNEESSDMLCAELVLGIQLDNKIIELSNLRTFNCDYNNNNYKSIFTLLSETFDGSEAIDLDAYRSVVSSPYQVVSGSFSGTLCLIIKLKIIDTFNISYTAKLLVDE